MTEYYPDDDELEKIIKWHPSDFKGLMEYVCDLWSEYGTIKKRGNVYTLITGGWSGNESIIGALKENTNFFWTLCWQSSKRGGTHVFRARNIT